MTTTNTQQHVVRGTPKYRLRSKLYLFNSFGMLGIYVIIAIFNFILYVFPSPRYLAPDTHTTQPNHPPRE